MNNSHDFFKKMNSILNEALSGRGSGMAKYTHPDIEAMARAEKDEKAAKEKADKDFENYRKGNVRANWGDKAERGSGSGKEKVEEGWSDENPDEDKSEWAEKQQCMADDKRKADKEDAACKALDKAKKSKKPSNTKESAGEFFRRYADIITEAESYDDDEDPDVKIADKVKGKDGATQSDAEKKLPPWLQKKDVFDKKDKKAEDAGSKKAKKDKDI